MTQFTRIKATLKLQFSPLLIFLSILWGFYTWMFLRCVFDAYVVGPAIIWFFLSYVIVFLMGVVINYLEEEK